MQTFNKTDPPSKVMFGGDGALGSVGIGFAFYRYVAALIITIICVIATVGTAVFDGVDDLMAWIKGTPKSQTSAPKKSTSTSNGSALPALAFFSIFMSIITALLYLNYKEVKKHPGLATVEGVGDVFQVAETM